jgi:TolB-like protein/DNA-binding winged helix-turn-helix (wHTH) protein/Tfp pilus assembly protein PilF
VELKQGFKLGPFEVRPLTGDVAGAEGTQHLEPKVMEVLHALAQHPGEVVEREELLKRIWGARAAVADEPLTRCIAELRRALGDSRQTPVFIQTIPKRGYRLVCSVEPLAAPCGLAAPPVVAPAYPEATQTERDAAPTRSAGHSAETAWRPRAVHPALAGGGLVSVLALAAIALWATTRPAPDNRSGEPIDRNTIAVLPFTDVGGTDDGAYFGEGLADEILSRLSAVEGLRVVARTSSFAVRASADDVRGIGQRLSVAHVLEGTVRRDGERVRIDVQLVDAEQGFGLWNARYDGVLGDIFALQDEIANTIVAKLRDTVPSELAAAPIATSAPTTNLAAYELLLRGRQYLDRRDEASLRHSIRLFEEAIALDAGYGQAYVELAKAYALLPSYSAEIQEEMFDQALATLAKGVAQDPSLDASMQGVLALVAYARWDWITAEVAFRRALEQAHNDPDLLVWYSQFLSAVGRPAESAEYALRAKQLDVLSPVVNHRLSVASMWIDADAEAARYAAIAEELGMGATPDAYIVLKLRQRDYAAVRPLLIGVQTMFAKPTAWVDPLLGALASPGRRAQAVEALARAEQARDVPPKYLFGAWLYLGEAERAVNAGLRLANDRPSFNVEFIFSREALALRQHPRFGELVRAIGLSRYWDRFGWPPMCRKSGEAIACG